MSGHTIPRLELCAAVLAVNLAEEISEHLEIPLKEMKFYTDSKVILGYLNNRTRRFYIYVQNRVSRILKSTTADQWYYISTEKNPADEGTRPMSPDQLQNSKWLSGPDFLKNPKLQLTIENYELQTPENDKEVRPLLQCLKTVSTSEQRLAIERFMEIKNWQLMVNIVALLKGKARALKLGKTSSISASNRADLLKEAEACIIRAVQHQSFKTELESLTSEKKLPKNSALQGLNVFTDKFGILRVGGRLRKSRELSLDEKHPIVLPKSHFVSKLITLHFHERVRHQGIHFTEGAIRTGGFWIVGVKRLIRSIIHDCVKCKKLRGKPASQLMADLPEDRLTPGAPFSSVGVDVFGPWSVITRRTRGGISNSKRWAVLYTCLTTRAIHIEVIEELSTSSFINATKRFLALRGPVKIFRSDRGSNFVGATDCLDVNAINVEDGPMKTFMDTNRTNWIFNSPLSSHMGGVWERLIGVVRRILDSMFSEFRGNLTHEVLSTFMAEVCSIVNSRPLVQVSVDPENPMVLSPAQLLTQKPVDENQNRSDTSIKDMYKVQWRRVKCLSDIFWKRWKCEYLHTLQKHKKWATVQRDLQIGDIVLVVENDCYRNDWPMGIITEVFSSEDGHVRKAKVKICRSDDSEPKYYVRPITKLVPLLEGDQKCL